MQTIQHSLRSEHQTWRGMLPSLRGARVELRQPRASDAESLCELLSTPETRRFVSAPPSTVGEFERFIERARQFQAAGAAICYAITLRGQDTAIGIFQIRETEPGFSTAEWGFAIGSPFWGMGLFQEAAELVLAFAFGKLGVRRLEARAVVGNGRGNRALRKLGAVQEGVLRRAFLREDGVYVDQALHTIIADDWQATGRMSRHLVH